jgi:hypothetical protein
MAADALIDAGAILALLDRTDRWHAVCVEAFQLLRLPLVTSEAVPTELCHLAGESRYEMETAWKFVFWGAPYRYSIAAGHPRVVSVGGGSVGGERAVSSDGGRAR